jgi:hypothetical protein
MISEPNKRLTRQQAIRAKCLDCCCAQSVEVRNCQITKCPLWIYRMGYEVKIDERSDDFDYECLD